MTERFFTSEIGFGLHAEDPEGRVLTATSTRSMTPQDHGGFTTLWKLYAPEILKSLGVTVNSSGYTSQGGRLYFDFDEHISARTPEVRRPEEIVTYEAAAETIVYSALKQLQTLGLMSNFLLNKRSTDAYGNDWGYQESVTTGMEKLEPEEIEFLAAHNISRAIYGAAGGLLMDRNGRLEYALSPRLSIAQTLTKTFNITPKPLVCDAISADTDTFWLHQFALEATNSPWATAVRHGMNEVVVALIEQHEGIDDLIVEEPVKTARRVGRDPLGREKLILKDGRTITAADWQHEMASRARMMDALKDNLSLGARWALNQVLDITDVLTLHPQAAADRVEWIAKSRYLSEKRSELNDKMPRSERNQHMLRHEILWSLVGRGVAAQKKRTENWGWGSLTPASKKVVREAITRPPQDTRARVRGAFVEKDPGKVTGNSTIRVDYSSFYQLRPGDDNLAVAARVEISDT